MGYRVAWLVCCWIAPFTSSAQELLQEVRGTVRNALTSAPIASAEVLLVNNEGEFRVMTGEDGNFLIEVPVGRYKAVFQHEAHGQSLLEIFVVAGRPTIVNVALAPGTIQLQEVEVSASPDTDLPGQRSLTIEKSLRIPANFFDPVRSLTAYPGVIAANDQNNSIIVRGNSPNGLLWRLNGADIVNPNHLANAGTLSDLPAANGGGVNILSAQMLDRTDVYMGAVPIQYGNLLSAALDMKLREGNKKDHNFVAQASVIGVDLAAEGPMGRNERTSFLANYRYSTVGLLSAAGVDFGDESIAFQDFALNIDHSFSHGGSLSFFGFWGNSRNEHDILPEEEWDEEKDLYDIDYRSTTYAAGIHCELPLRRSRFNLSAAFSSSAQRYESKLSPLFNRAYPYALALSDNEQENTVLSIHPSYHAQLARDVTLTAGAVVNRLGDDWRHLEARGTPVSFTSEFEEQVKGTLLQPYVELRSRLKDRITLAGGARYVRFSYNSTESFEPRVMAAFDVNSASSVSLSYGRVSQVQRSQLYRGSGDLELSKTDRYDLAYSTATERGLSYQVNLFYQRLSDIPVYFISFSPFIPYWRSSINFIEGTAVDGVESNGTGTNYGLDTSVEKRFFTGHYFLAGASYYESTYTVQGQRYDSRFNGNYTITGVYGKEWAHREKRRRIGANVRALYFGGLRAMPVDEAASRSYGVTYPRYGDPFGSKLSDYFRVDFRVSFIKNKPGYTRTFAVDIQNISNIENESDPYFDIVQDKVVKRYQLGMIPVLVYRIEF